MLYDKYLFKTTELLIENKGNIYIDGKVIGRIPSAVKGDIYAYHAAVIDAFTDYIFKKVEMEKMKTKKILIVGLFVISFLKQCSGIQKVKAWDGFSAYVNTEFEYSIRSSKWYHIFMNSAFDNWSYAKNGRIRCPGGLITYERKNGMITTTPNYKKYSNQGNGKIKIITEVIK